MAPPNGLQPHGYSDSIPPTPCRGCLLLAFWHFQPRGRACRACVRGIARTEPACCLHRGGRHLSGAERRGEPAPQAPRARLPRNPRRAGEHVDTQASRPASRDRNPAMRQTLVLAPGGPGAPGTAARPPGSSPCNRRPRTDGATEPRADRNTCRASASGTRGGSMGEGGAGSWLFLFLLLIRLHRLRLSPRRSIESTYRLASGHADLSGDASEVEQ